MLGMTLSLLGIKGGSVEQLADPHGADYFPNGRVANNSAWLSPVTGSDMYGEPVDVPFQTGAYPARDDGPQHSWDQGEGRSPGQQWPHMPIREQFSFEKSSNLSGIMEDDTAALPADSNANPLFGKHERAGWAMLGPALAGEYFGQDPDQHFYILDPTSIELPPSMSLTALAHVGGDE